MSLIEASLKPPSALPIDLAGKCPSRPNFVQCQGRIAFSIDRLLCVSSFNQRIEDLGRQFKDPQPRIWQPIQWRNVSSEQIIGTDPHLYCELLAKSAEIEIPSLGYSVESRAYLGKPCPRMARFMGGIRSREGAIEEFGVWEKEEQTHGPVLRKLYRTLAGKEPTLSPASLRGYLPQGDWEKDAYRHLVFRMTHEYMAVAGYIMFIALSTGELQQVLQQITQDEISHWAKFFGFIRWRFGKSFLSQFYGMVSNTIHLTRLQAKERDFFRDFDISNGEIIKMYFLYEWSKMLALKKLWVWNRQLTSGYLDSIFAMRVT